MKDILAKIGKLEGGAALVADIEAALKKHGENADTLESELVTLKAAKKALEAEKAKLAADLEKAGKGDDVRIAALTKDLEAARGEVETTKAERQRDKLMSALDEKMSADITDKHKRKHAVETFARNLPEDVRLDDKGKLIGADKHLKTFKEDEETSWLFKVEEGKGAGGERAGGKPPPKTTGKPNEMTTDEKIAHHRALLYPTTTEA